MHSTLFNPDRQYSIGVIGDIPALLAFWEMFRNQVNDSALREIGIVAAALPGETPMPSGYESGTGIPTYAGFRTMLEKHPEINMVIEASGRQSVVTELRASLPAAITIVERGAANFFIKLLTSDKMWVACKLDLMHTQSMLKTIVDQMDEEILFLTREGTVRDANRTVLSRVGLSKKQVVGKSMCDVFGTPESITCEGGKDPFAETVKSGEPADATYSQVGEDGRVQYFRIYTYPIKDEDGSLNHVVAVRRNITQRRAIENRLRQAEKLASIGELSYYIAHEIRNPMFTISGFANSLMRTEGLADKSREKLGIILEESKRLDEILKSLMNFTRPTGAEVHEVDLNDVTRATMDVMTFPCTNQGIDVVLDLDESVARVRGNPDLIKQCLINLVKNSIEAMPNGGKLVVATGMSRDKAVLTVEDTGCGIPADIRDKIFSPFFSTKGKGSGLGLAQTKIIMEEIGGDVDLVSRVNMGTKVSLVMPPLLAVAESGESG
ncbi:two-component system sensor histidine kinase NtrB [Pseudodesulfovibrio tunisiensis]|uniref:two-component system sensor histidine kinase NtrB n=1 Tax=Pseudodesulfovibrio tunisiensis TaxID=463192 RepID=UPI001FB46E00|nr:ATP-binding protein [Pseudodesulfovibrio tunisiensis]